MKIQDKAAFDQAECVLAREWPTPPLPQYFIGNSYLNPLTKPGESVVGLANVTFEPGCRNNWHIHHAKSRRRTDPRSAPPARAGTRRRTRTPSALHPGHGHRHSAGGQSTGMAPRRTAGSATSPWRCPARRPAMNGWNRWTTPALPNCRDRSGARAAGCRPPKEYAQARRGGGLFPREKTGLAPALPGERSFAL